MEKGLKINARFAGEGSKEKVLKIDRPLAGGFLSLMGPSGPRVEVSPLRAMNIYAASRQVVGAF